MKIPRILNWKAQLRGPNHYPLTRSKNERGQGLVTIAQGIRYLITMAVVVDAVVRTGVRKQRACNRRTSTVFSMVNDTIYGR